jgi:hypothetical protein
MIATIEKKGNIDIINIINFLLANGANVNLQNNKGNTALAFAIVNNDISRIELLVKNRADVNIRNIKGQSIYYITTRFNKSTEQQKINILKILKEYGLNLEEAREEALRRKEALRLEEARNQSRKRKAEERDGKRISKSLRKNLKKKSTRKLSRKKKSTRKLSRKKKSTRKN